MSKLMLVSILIASIVIPYVASRTEDAHQGLRNMVVRTGLFMLAYCMLLRFVYPRLQ